jgi:hypothetical protein
MLAICDAEWLSAHRNTLHIPRLLEMIVLEFNMEKNTLIIHPTFIQFKTTRPEIKEPTLRCWLGRFNQDQPVQLLDGNFIFLIAPRNTAYIDLGRYVQNNACQYVQQQDEIQNSSNTDSEVEQPQMDYMDAIV